LTPYTRGLMGRREAEASTRILVGGLAAWEAAGSRLAARRIAATRASGGGAAPLLAKRECRHSGGCLDLRMHAGGVRGVE
jgi:hypothetical protein